MALHDHTASVLSLARTVLQGVDPSQIETRVNSASLVLLLETLIGLGTQPTQMQAPDTSRTLAGRMAALNDGVRNG